MLILFDGNKSCAFKHGIAGIYGYRCHTSVASGMYGVFHFHGFEEHHCVGGLDGVAYFYGYGNHCSGQGRFDSCSRACACRGFGDNFFAGCGARCGRWTRRLYGSDFCGFCLVDFDFVRHAVHFHLGQVVVDVAYGNIIDVAVDFIFVLFQFYCDVGVLVFRLIVNVCRGSREVRRSWSSRGSMHV